jgi:hypothetical protein
MLEHLEQQKRLTGNQWRIIATANLGDMLDFFDFFLIGYVLAFIIGSWQLTFGQSAVILLASGLGAVPGAFFWGWMADRIGRRKVFMATALNVAIATGSPAVDVLDVDVKPDGNGFAAFRRLKHAGLLTGASGLVRTRSGGLHVYFTGTGQDCGRLPAHHLDFKAAGGYVIAPPSFVEADDTGPAGTYELLDQRELPLRFRHAEPAQGDEVLAAPRGC